jgi:hypothetical protein
MLSELFDQITSGELGGVIYDDQQRRRYLAKS